MTEFNDGKGPVMQDMKNPGDSSDSGDINDLAVPKDFDRMGAGMEYGEFDSAERQAFFDSMEAQTDVENGFDAVSDPMNDDAGSDSAMSDTIDYGSGNEGVQDTSGDVQAETVIREYGSQSEVMEGLRDSSTEQDSFDKIAEEISKWSNKDAADN